MMPILSHTPGWVFVLFACLLGLGLLQTRNRHVPLRSAYLLPMAMLGFSAWGMQQDLGFTPVSTSVWFISLVGAAVTARKHFLHSALSFNLSNQRFFIPGSWIPLAVIMLIFLSKYALTVFRIRTASTLGLEATAAFSCLLGISSGYFAARALALFTVAQRTRTASAARP